MPHGHGHDKVDNEADDNYSAMMETTATEGHGHGHKKAEMTEEQR